MDRKWNRCFILLLLFVLLMNLAACGGRNLSLDGGQALSQDGKKISQNEDRLRVVTTLFPYYDFIRQTAGDLVDLELVIPAGMDSHSFEPTPADMRLIQSADVLICNGGSMEAWLGDVLGAIDTDGMVIVTMMDYVENLEEEIVEGMEDEEHGHDHDYDGNGDGHDYDHDGNGDDDDHSADAAFAGDHDEEAELDEHIWTSPVNAIILVDVIADVLAAADPQHAKNYEANAAVYQQELYEIDAGFREIVANRKRDTIVVADKFSFRYFVEEYGLNYRAAFSGCSTDTEPSAKTIAYLIDLVKEMQIPAVYYLELSSSRVADIIQEETGAEPLLLHSCHNVTRVQFDSGITYAQLMRQNMENLRRGLDE